jgi:hypothetical protein
MVCSEACCVEPQLDRSKAGLWKASKEEGRARNKSKRKEEIEDL